MMGSVNSELGVKASLLLKKSLSVKRCELVKVQLSVKVPLLVKILLSVKYKEGKRELAVNSRLRVKE